MTVLFNLLVFALLLGIALAVFMEHRQLRHRHPVAVPYEEVVLPQCGRDGHSATTVQRVIGLAAWVQIHLEFYKPPNRRGITSPITSLVSTRQQDEHGTVYEMTTASGSRYLVSMPDDTAKAVLSTYYYAWKNGRHQ